MSDEPGSLRFGFVQWDLPGRLGPEPGRYAVRRFAGDDARSVVVVARLAAPRRAPRVRRRSRVLEAGHAPDPVEVTRVTVVGTEPLGDAAAAVRWLERAAGAGAAATVEAALRLLDRAVQAHRVAAADPYAADVAPYAALVTRVGFGTAGQTAEGTWEAAREVAAPAAPAQAPGPRARQERLAALLAARDVALACEELALRARLDLDHDRQREAALQTRIALDAARSELEGWRDLGGMARRLDELHAHAPAVAAVADAALQGGLDPEALDAVRAALECLEEALRERP
jgi:hypothetical protein